MTQPAQADSGDSLNDELHEAIAAVLRRHQTSLITGWVVLAEVVDETGEFGLWTATAPKMPPWRVLGLLHHATATEDASVAAHYLSDEGDPD